MTDVEKIALHYGFAEQSRQTIEEMAELTVAISKIHRGWGKETYNNLIEEIADVEIMLEQLKYLSNSCYQVRNIKKQKIQRQLNRIKAEKKQ